jgi:hypothetical protein
MSFKIKSKPNPDTFMGPNILVYYLDNSGERGYYSPKCSYIIGGIHDFGRDKKFEKQFEQISLSGEKR